MECLKFILELINTVNIEALIPIVYSFSTPAALTFHQFITTWQWIVASMFNINLL
jgi:hypothetical protein